MRSYVAFAAAALALAGLGRAEAADLPARVLKAAPLSPVSYAWSGFYVGLHAGYGWSDGRTDIGIVDPGGQMQAAAAVGVFPTAYTFDRDGYVVGGQAGYNYQSGKLVLGIEGDLSATGINGGVSNLLTQCATCFAPVTSSVSHDMDWFGTFRGRVGHAADNWLFYATGGLAFGHVKTSYIVSNAPFGGPLTIAGSASDVLFGWTVGGGIEYGFGPWSAKFEYLYYDLGSISFSAPNPLAPPGVALVPSFKTDGSIVRGGINYRFAPGR